MLVCTLGTLILLLALVAQNASTAAVAEAEQKQAAAKTAAPKTAPKPTGMTRDEAMALIDEGKFRVEQLVMIRDQQTADIERRREQMTQVESHMRKIRTELKRLSAEVDLATGEKEMKSTNAAQLQVLEQKLNSEQAALAKLRGNKMNQKPKVAIIPHKGPNGTDRRPVYVECTSDGVTIWPEECKITHAQLEEAVSGANPLDAALRVVRHHALQNYGDSVAPYPMLVVRPDGIETYAVARASLHEWDDQFGYELVPAEVDLAYDNPDRKLKSLVMDAIHGAVIKQHGLNALAKRAAQAYNGSQPSGRRRYPRLSASAMDRRGRAAGFEDHREDFARRSAYAAQQRSAMNYQDHSGSSTGADFARDFDQHLREAASELSASEESESLAKAGPLTNNPFHSTRPSTHQSQKDAVDGSGGKSDQRGLNGGTAQLGDRKQPVSSHKPSSGQPSANDAHTNLYLSPIIPQEAVVRSESNPFVIPEAQGRLESQSQNTGSMVQSGKSAQSGNHDTASRHPQLQASGFNPNTGQSSRPSSNAQTSPTSGSQNSSPQSDTKQPSATITRELVKRRGANWALPPSITHTQGNAIVRTIRVQCYPNRMVLMPPSRGGATEMFGLADNDMNRATIELASAVRDRIKRWGAAIPGGRWQPRLDVEVMPQGEQRFYQLQRLMSGSGVEISGRASQTGVQP